MSSISLVDREKLFKRHTGLIIHIFAAAHAATAIVTRVLDYYDDIPLTVLTISMLIIIALRRRLSLTATAITTLTVTLLGYLLGVWCGQQLDALIGSPLAASAITTFVLTEIFGWGVVFLALILKGHDIDYNRNHTPIIRQIVAAAFLILVVRVTYSLIFRTPYFIMHGGIYAQFGELFSNTFATLTMLCLIAMLVSLPKRERRTGIWQKPLGSIIIAAAIALFPLLPTVAAYYDFPQILHQTAAHSFNRYDFAGLYAVALLSTFIAYPAAMLVRFSISSIRTIHSERSEKISEQYKYTKLKQQISPHFLFNSLNILDSLIQSGENDRAGAYIRKLASLYRYILKNEDKKLVYLDDELEFTEMYIDLLKERFAEGLTVEYDIFFEDRLYLIVPCGLQMLIENAIKHNVVGAESPLHIKVAVEGHYISVTNNLQPRISTQPSTQLGLKNLSRQYEDLSLDGIQIQRTDTEFKVLMPLC